MTYFIRMNMVGRVLVFLLLTLPTSFYLRAEEGDPPSPDSPLPKAAVDAPGSSPSADSSRKDDIRRKSGRTESESRQFIIYGADFSTRVALASLAEEMRLGLLSAVGEGEAQWEYPIVIRVREEDGPVRTSYFAIPGGYRIQMEVSLSQGKPAGLERAILELLLIEYGLRDRADTGIESVGVPLWLVEGMRETFRWRDGVREHAIYEALFDKNELYPVNSILQIRKIEEMDLVSKAAFRASSGALVMSLLEQERGQESMRTMLGELATFEGDEVTLLRKHFPGMNLGPESLAKWWALQVARMAEKPFPYVLTIIETERQLSELLTVRFNDSEGRVIAVGPEDFRDLLALPTSVRESFILSATERIRQFFYRCFPAYRIILQEYHLILSDLASDKDDRIAERLQALQSERDRLVSLGRRTRDYLEWYRITSAKELTGKFDNFIDLKKRLETLRGKNEGPIGLYMDSIQRLFSENGNVQDR